MQMLNLFQPSAVLDIRHEVSSAKRILQVTEAIDLAKHDVDALLLEVRLVNALHTLQSHIMAWP